MTDPNEMTLAELRDALGPLIAAEAAFDSWSEAALVAGAATLSIPPERARLAVDGGAIQMIDLWFASIDRAIVQQFAPEELAAMRIRDRIRTLVLARVECLVPHREALRRALAILASPTNVAHSARLAWRAADVMWRLAGDRAVGAAHYSKRLTLAGVYGATLLVFLQDENDELADTRSFLDRRLGEVMQFERVKAKFRPDPERRFNITRFLGRMRYPVA